MKNNGFININNFEWSVISMFLKDPVVVSLGVFVASSAWYLGLTRRNRETLTDSNRLSTRGNKTISKDPLPYMQGFLEALKNPCDPIVNPEGYIGKEQYYYLLHHSLSNEWLFLTSF